MSVSSVGSFIKLIKVQCTKTWVSPQRRDEGSGGEEEVGGKKIDASVFDMLLLSDLIRLST